MIINQSTCNLGHFNLNFIPLLVTVSVYVPYRSPTNSRVRTNNPLLRFLTLATFEFDKAPCGTWTCVDISSFNLIDNYKGAVGVNSPTFKILLVFQ